VSVAARCAEPAPRPERVARIRPARRLTKAQLEALNTLQRLGASTLTQDFSGDQLRAAYRALAKRYHPDGRPGSSPAETARLASTFASLCDAYRELIGPSRDARTAANR
jgi:hypothetical protein